MQFCFPALMAAVLCGQSPQAEYRSANFLVSAPTPEAARLIGEAAETCRRDFARTWLEKALADWPFPCRIDAAITLGPVGGSTDVEFSEGTVTAHRVTVRGPLERLIKGPLPHELTHVLFAHYFGFQPPRWADEGGAILSEDPTQGERQGKLFHKIVSEDRQFALRRLLGMRHYPADMACLYAQGHSVSRFLVASKTRKVFLAFVRDGFETDWDEAVHTRYGYEDVEDLEKAWRTWVDRQAHAEAVPERLPTIGADGE